MVRVPVTGLQYGLSVNSLYYEEINGTEICDERGLNFSLNDTLELVDDIDTFLEFDNWLFSGPLYIYCKSNIEGSKCLIANTQHCCLGNVLDLGMEQLRLL